MTEAKTSKAPAAPKIKKFYQSASAKQGEDGWQVLLDDKTLKTAAKDTLLLPNEALANAIAAEWDAQGEHIEPNTMPNMQFACAAQDYVAKFRADVEAETIGYVETDLLCYQASEPEELAKKQHEAWTPLLVWAEQHYGVKPKLAGGIMPVEQDAMLIAKLEVEVSAFDLLTLTALWLMTRNLGSLLLAMAVMHGQVDASEAFTLSRVEELHQNAEWGEDEEALEKRAISEAEMDYLKTFLALIGS